MSAPQAFAHLVNPPGFDLDLDVLRAFERGLDPAQPERSAMPAQVLGYGEISTVFAIDRDDLRGLAFKRLPIFNTEAEIARYEQIYTEYLDLLNEQIGVRTAPGGYAAFLTETDRPVFYIIQQQRPAGRVAHHALHTLPEADALRLFRQVLGELARVWQFSVDHPHLRVGIDGQLSNWVVEGAGDVLVALPAEPQLLYLDTSTPTFRIDGVGQLDPELFLRSAPSFLRWLLRLLFLNDVVNRYYDLQQVVLDVIANLYKEQKPELIPGFVEVANAFFQREAPELSLAPFTEKAAERYYREDATIWRAYLGARRLDRALHHTLGREYPYILPGPIAR